MVIFSRLKEAQGQILYGKSEHKEWFQGLNLWIKFCPYFLCTFKPIISYILFIYWQLQFEAKKKVLFSDIFPPEYL